ncbi:hypothetical protein FRC01_000944 [Tulasnella sp. 417]|nr:hypothetical protein FRC01_000944 [Tulasnella sp. 417]
MAQSADNPKILAPTLATPSSASGPHTYSIFIGIANVDPDTYLFGVEGDLPMVVEELGARTTKTLYAITDIPLQIIGDRARVLRPTLECLKSTIEEVGTVLGPRDCCHIYPVGGDLEVEDEQTSFIGLPGGERLYGNVLATWLQAAARRGGTIITLADVCHSTAFLNDLTGMPVVYDIDGDGSLHHDYPNSELREPQGQEAQVIVISSTKCGQLARTIQIAQGKYAGLHGFFTWIFFDCLRKNPAPVDTAALLFHLRKESNRHPEKPTPQISATTTGLRQLPV